jgi:hypothetical protein
MTRGAAAPPAICHNERRAARPNVADRRPPMFSGRPTEAKMDEDRFNMDIRKFLKVVGVTSQREIELAVRAALDKGTLTDTAVLKPRVTLRIPEIGLEHVVDGEIALK